MSDKFQIQDIMKLLPHRYPFLLVDRVLEWNDDGISVIKNVTINEPYFVGHFPHEPIMPGVLQLEAMAQAAGVWAIKHFKLNSDSSVYFMTIDKVKFRKPVVPGDQLLLKVKIKSVSGSRLSFTAEAEVDGQKVSQAEMMAMVKKQADS